MRKLYSLLAWFSCSASATRLYGVDYDSVETFDLERPAKTLTSGLYEKFAHLTISSSAKPSQNTPRTLDQISSFVLTKEHSLRELNEALRVLIDIKGTTVDEASAALLNNPLPLDLTESIINEAVWGGYHHVLRSLQSKKLKILPPFNSNYKTHEMKMLHKLLAYSYKRSWSDPLFWKDHLHKMDWVEFWWTIFEADNVQLFNDLVTQELSLPFNRLVNLNKSKLSELVKKYKANKIGAYLGIPDCKEAIIFDEDGRLDINLLNCDELGRPLFDTEIVASVAIKLNNLDFLQKFKSTHPQNFPHKAIANEALCQARFYIFNWVRLEYPGEKLSAFNLDLGILGSGHLEERLEFLHWIFEQFPEWVPCKDTTDKPLPEIREIACKFNPTLCLKQEEFSNNPSYDLLKWALKNEPEWIPIGWSTHSWAKCHHDLDLQRFMFTKLQTAKVELRQHMAITPFYDGDMDIIRDCVLPHRIPMQEELLAAARNGHVKVLEELASMGYKINFSHASALTEIIYSGNIHVVKYIHRNYPEIFTRPIDIRGILVTYAQKGKKSTLEMLKYLYESFTPENIRLSLASIVELNCQTGAPVLLWILENHPETFNDEITSGNKKTCQVLKQMIMGYATTHKNRKKVEFLMNRFQDNLEWSSGDLDSIARHGSFYLLDMIYRDHGGDESLWDPLKRIGLLAYLQWYYLKVTKDLPWEDLALYYGKSEGDHYAPMLYWISIKKPDVPKLLNQRMLECSNRHDAYRYGGSIAALAWFIEKSETIYYTPENAALIEDEVSKYYQKRELWSR